MFLHSNICKRTRKPLSQCAALFSNFFNVHQSHAGIQPVGFTLTVVGEIGPNDMMQSLDESDFISSSPCSRFLNPFPLYVSWYWTMNTLFVEEIIADLPTSEWSILLIKSSSVLFSCCFHSQFYSCYFRTVLQTHFLKTVQGA